jgi:hypothetical protein
VTDEDEQYARLKLASGRAEEIWRDTLTLPEPVRGETFAMWLDEGDDWHQDADRLATIVDAVTILGTIAGAVSGIGGAAQTIANLAKGA